MGEAMAGAGGYKEKYLKALDEQELTEKKYALQVELLKGALLSLCVASKGQHSELDATLLALQNSLRGAAGVKVYDNVERLKRVVAKFDSSRDGELKATADHFCKLIDNLLTLSLPSEIEAKLSACKRDIKKKATSYRAFGEAAKVVCDYQRQALNAAADPSMPIWQRIKKGRSLIAQKTQGTDSATTVKDVSTKVEVDHQPNDDDTTDRDIDAVNISDDVHALNAVSGLAQGKSFTHIEEQDTYPQVAKRINTTLKNLVQSIDSTDTIKRKVEIVLDRIQRGMDWFSLSVTLEDIRDILMARYLDADKQFSEYLKNLNFELGSISEALGAVEQTGQQRSHEAKELSTTVSLQMDKMQHSVDTIDTLDDLQGTVNDHIKTIRSALNNFDASSNNAEQSLSQQLTTLLERVRTVEEESQESRKQLEEQRYRATHDPLTELPNREAYNERAFHELHRFKRYGHPLTLAICDIDFFKKINDNFGHQAGDKVLKLVAQLVAKRLRQVDFVARYGGEEFVLLMPETTAQDALSVLDKIRMAIAKTPFRFKQSPLTITMSFGIKQFEQDDCVESAFEKADKALYDAKSAGRNQCIIAP